MAQITQTVAQGILDGQGYTDSEVRQLAHFWLSASAPAPSVLEDAALLDWLEAQGTVAIERCKYLGSDDAVIEVTPYNDDSYEGDTLRGAIRAAMAAKKGDTNG